MNKIFHEYFLHLYVCFIVIAMLFFSAIPALAADPPSSVDLQAGSDSGLHDDDNLTNVSSPTIDITAANGVDSINIYREDVLRYRGCRQPQ